MELETAQTTTAKLPILKQGEYDMWRLRIKQYFQVQDYALWDITENGNSFNLVPQTTNPKGTSTTLMLGPVTTKEKLQKKNDIWRLQKIVTQLAILVENISQEDLNFKFLRSLPFEWNTYIMVWRNKPDLDIMSFDDLHNNFKIVEQEIKRTTTTSSSSISQNMVFVLTPSSTNEVNTGYRVSTSSFQVNTASIQVNTANLSDATVYTFLANQLNRSHLVNEDLEQIHEDDLEEMDLKWQLALLSMRARRECRGPRNQDGRYKNQDSTIKIVNMEDTSSKAMVAIYEVGFDWSYMAEDEVPTNMALMALLDSEVYTDKTCSKTCLKNYETLKKQNDDLRIELNKSKFNLATYKRRLATIEEQLVFYKKNEVIFCDQIVVLKRDISFKDAKISVLKSELEKLKKDKESNQLKIENFDNTFKCLDKLIGSQIVDKSKKGLGYDSYHAVPPPPTRMFSPPKLDLSYSGLEEFKQPEFEGYGPKTSENVSDNIYDEIRNNISDLLVEELVSNDKLEKKVVSPTVSKSPRGNQRKSQLLGSEFLMYNKACFVCGSFDYVQAAYKYHQRERLVTGNNYTRVNYNYTHRKTYLTAHRNMVPKAVLMKSGLRPLNTTRTIHTSYPKTIVYSTRPKSCFSKLVQSTVRRPIQMKKALTNRNINQKFYTTKGKVNTVKSKAVNTTTPHSAVVNDGHPQNEDQGYVDSGCSNHMTGNMSHLTDFKEFDGGYVAFGGGAKGGRITSKGTLKIEPIPNVASSSHQKTQTPRQALHKVTKLPQTSDPIPNVVDEAVYEEWDDKAERATTTATSLYVEQASGTINRTQSTAKPNVPLPQKISAGGSPSTTSVPVSTTGAGISTDSPTISVAKTLVYIRRNATKDKGKGIVQETKQPKRIKKKVQIQMSLDEELAQKIHEEKVARYKAEQEAKFTEEQEELLKETTDID
ncbi:hypothetical protein Tco_0413460 [Tanacetum coccineum]